MTMGAFSLNYIKFLHNNVSQQFNPFKLYLYPNINLPQYRGKINK